MNALDAFAALDAFGRSRRACFFAFDHLLENAAVLPLDGIDPGRLLFELRGKGNAPGLAPLACSTAREGSMPGLVSRVSSQGGRLEPLLHQIRPPGYDQYQKAFALAQEGFVAGDSWLLNLTAASQVEFDEPLDRLFWLARAPYRLYVDNILVFSPECFVTIDERSIRTFPMKGSLRCPAALAATGREALLADGKELAEHVTVVDLLRNDLGRVAERVQVPRFRYLEEIALGSDVLLQTSSEIVGEMASDWPDRLGSILRELLPAGSVTGAPKLSTCRRITAAEALLGRPRGWYTGVFGVFDGRTVDSAVMIRFIEIEAGNSGLPFRGWFHSGGGLTYDSRPESEYAELVAKVAIPTQPLLMETIRVEDGVIQGAAWHALRMARSAAQAWGLALDGDVTPDWASKLIDQAFAQAGQGLAGIPESNMPGRWRLRFEYSPLGLIDTQLFAYQIRRPVCLYLVEVGGLVYDCKYADRSEIEALRNRVKSTLPADHAQDWDILLCRNGNLLEASYAGIVCELVSAPGGPLILATPLAPLLASTRLAAYQAKGGGFIQTMDLRVADLARISGIRLVNAMLDLEDQVAIEEIRWANDIEKVVWSRCNSL